MLSAVFIPAVRPVCGLPLPGYPELYYLDSKFFVPNRNFVAHRIVLFGGAVGSRLDRSSRKREWENYLFKGGKDYRQVSEY